MGQADDDFSQFFLSNHAAGMVRNDGPAGGWDRAQKPTSTKQQKENDYGFLE